MKIEKEERVETMDKRIVFTVSPADILTRNVNEILHQIVREVIEDIKNEVIKRYKEDIIAKIDMVEIASAVKTRTSFAILNELMPKKEKTKQEESFCTLGCPDKIENLHQKRMYRNKRSEPVDPELCYERKRYKCRLIDK